MILFGEIKNLKKKYDLAFNYMILSLEKIVNFAKKNRARVAIETEGSLKKKIYCCCRLLKNIKSCLIILRQMIWE